jgi:hypothetical protein
MERLKAKPLGTAVLAAGVLLVLLAVLADAVGIGGQSGFGWKQGVLLAAGVLALIVGGAIVSGMGGQAVREATEPPPPEGDERPMPPPE